MKRYQIIMADPNAALQVRNLQDRVNALLEHKGYRVGYDHYSDNEGPDLYHLSVSWSI